jgi:outer membrane protein
MRRFTPGGLCGVGAIAVATALLGMVSAPPPPVSAEGLTIEGALQLAGSSSEAIRIGDLAVTKARLAREEAASRSWPHVDLQASAAYLVNPPTGYTVEAGALGVLPPPLSVPVPTEDFSIGAQPYDYVSIAATLSQPLFTWGKIRNAVDAAALDVDSARNELSAQRRNIAREVRRSYYSALLARESLPVLRELAEAASRIVADRQAALDEGTGTREAVLEARSREVQIDSRRIEAEQTLSTALESLGVLTGLDPSAIRLDSGFPPASPALDEGLLEARAEAASTDLASSRLKQKQAQKALDLERGGALLRPDVSLGLSLSATGLQNYLVLNGAAPNSSAATSWDWDLVISLNVKMSAFDGMQSAARIGQAEQDLKMAALSLVQARKLTRLAVRRAVEAAIRANADAAATQAAMDYAEERLSNARAAAENGVASQADLHEAQLLRGSARLDLLRAQFTREEALADIGKLTGSEP